MTSEESDEMKAWREAMDVQDDILVRCNMNESMKDEDFIVVQSHILGTQRRFGELHAKKERTTREHTHMRVMFQDLLLWQVVRDKIFYLLPENSELREKVTVVD